MKACRALRLAPALAVLAAASLALVVHADEANWPSFRGNDLQNGSRAAPLPHPLKICWTVKTGDAIEGTPAIVDGVVYIGSYDEHLYALELATGKEKWKTKLTPIKSPVTVHEGKVYVGDVDGNFYCLNAADGKQLWKLETGAEIAGGATIAGDNVLIGSHDQNLYCLNSKGQVRWKFATEGPVNGSAVVVGKRTFVAGCDSSLHILDIETGKELQAIDLGGQAGATAAIYGDHLYVGTMTNQMLGLDLKQGKIEWSFEASQRRQPFFASAAVTEKLVIAASRDKRVYGLNRRTGQEVWSFLTGNRIDSSPVVAGDRVYIGSHDETFYVLERDTGKLVQKLKLDGSILGSPAVAGNRLIIGTEKGTIYCLGE